MMLCTRAAQGSGLRPLAPARPPLRRCRPLAIRAASQNNAQPVEQAAKRALAAAAASLALHLGVGTTAAAAATAGPGLFWSLSQE